jgi:transposase-like protein
VITSPPELTRENFTPLGYIRRMKYTMNTKELARLTVIKGAIDGAYTVKQAARKLGISGRQVQYLKKAVREQGDGAVIHGNSGRHPVSVTAEAVRAKIIALKKSGPYRKAFFHAFSGTACGTRADTNQLYLPVRHS